MTRFVLVHGAFLGSWCWEPVTALLRAAGHEVDAPDLPCPRPGDGPGTGAGPVGLQAHAEQVGALLGRGAPAVLVGHSLGGMTISAVAARRPAGLVGLVYLAGFLPRAGQSSADLVRLPEGGGEGLRHRMLVAGDPPVATLSPRHARQVLFNTCTASVADAAVARLRPHATWLADARVGEGAEADVPRSYVVCTEDRAIPVPLQRRMAREARCSPVLDLATDHSPFLSDPTALAGALIRVARAQRAATGRPHDHLRHL